MKSVLLLALLAVTTSTYAQNWRPVLACDGGAAVIDVDQNNPTRLQIVVRDKNIVSYFNRSGVGAFPGSIGNATEVIRSGHNDSAVSNGRDVHSFSEGNQNSYSSYEYAYVWREGNGIKIKFESQHMGCPADCRENPLSMQCESLCVGAGIGSKYEIANWYFRDCR